MHALGIRYFFIIFCSLYAYLRILNIDTYKKSHYVYTIFFSLLLSLSIYRFTDNMSIFRLTLVAIVCYLYTTIYTKTQWHISLISCLLSFAFSFISLSFASFLSGTTIALYFDKKYYTSTICIFLTGFIQFIFIYLLFRIKRLRKGMPFLLHNTFINIGFLISIFIIALFFLLQQIVLNSSPSRLILLITMLLTALALLAWWRFKITQSYRNKLRVSEVESLYREISDKDNELERMMNNNNYLAKVIHKDNKVIPAMELAVRNYLQNAFTMPPDEAKEYGEALLAQLAQMTKNREGILHDYHKEAAAQRPQIGLPPVDAVILYMQQRAIAAGINYHYQYDKGLKDLMPSFISEKDVIHLLSDVLENALIATTHASDKHINIHIGFIQNTLFIDVSDSGIPFEPSTYQNFGIVPSSTHLDKGGSGIGLIDIGKIKKQYKISLHIYEYPSTKNEFTKKLRFLFDRKNHFLIQSYRAKEIKSYIIRNDLHVFPYIEDEI